jgi:hypothetical protein
MLVLSRLRDLSLALLVLPFLPACSGGGASIPAGPGGGTDGTTASYDLTGKWTGQMANAFGARGSVEGDLVQTGSSIEGTVRLQGGCIGGGKLSATLDGDLLSGTLSAGTAVVTLSLTATSADQLDGTFQMTASGACPAQQGSASMTRVGARR